MPSPAFQFYPDDFVGSGVVQAAEADEIGAYLLLLCLDWGEEGFAFDEKRLARVCRLSLPRFRVVWSHLADKFPERDGKHYNPRLEKERIKQAEWREKSAKGGATSAANRAKGGARVVEPPHQPEGQPNGNTPVSSLQSPSPLPKATTPLLPEHPAKAAERGGWPAKVAEAWVRRIGVIREGRVGKDLHPFVRLYPTPDEAIPALVRAVEIYDDTCQRRQQKPAWVDFVRGVQGFVPANLLPPERAA